MQRDGGAGGGGPGGGGGPMITGGGGAPGGGFGGGPGVFVLGGRPGRFNINQPHGSIFYSTDNSIFDAAPYSLNTPASLQTGPSQKPDYDQNRFGVTLGSPLKIPHVIKDEKTFVFLNWTGGRNSNPYDQYSTVPTLAERQGDEGEIMADDAQPEAGIADHQGEQHGEQHGERDAEPRRHLVEIPQQGGNIGADAEKGAVAERDEAEFPHQRPVVEARHRCRPGRELRLPDGLRRDDGGQQRVRRRGAPTRGDRHRAHR